MNVTNKTTRTFAIQDLTETQAQDLLDMTIGGYSAERSDSIKETLNSLRQALLSAGLKGGDTNAG